MAHYCMGVCLNYINSKIQILQKLCNINDVKQNKINRLDYYNFFFFVKTKMHTINRTQNLIGKSLKTFTRVKKSKTNPRYRQPNSHLQISSYYKLLRAIFEPHMRPEKTNGLRVCIFCSISCMGIPTGAIEVIFKL
jgi:hypothetical protein